MLRGGGDVGARRNQAAYMEQTRGRAGGLCCGAFGRRRSSRWMPTAWFEAVGGGGGGGDVGGRRGGAREGGEREREGERRRAGGGGEPSRVASTGAGPFIPRASEMTKMPPTGQAIYARWHGRGETVHFSSNFFLSDGRGRSRGRSDQATRSDGQESQIAEEPCEVLLFLFLDVAAILILS